MNILAVDSSSSKLSYSITAKGNLIYEYNRIAERGASSFIDKLDKTFKKLSLSMGFFDSFFVGAGPGSFTGLRISFSAIKALALATGKPVFSPNSFFACAYPFREKSEKIAVISDARRGLAYAAFFLSEGKGFQQESDIKLMKLKECLRGRSDYLFLTYDQSIRQEVSNLDRNFKVWPKDVYPQAKYLIESLNYKNWKKGLTNLSNLEPLYLHSVK